MFFFQLPDASHCWMDTKDVARFDSAVCSEEFRNQYLEFVSESTCIKNCDMLTTEIIEWIIERNIKIDKIIFDEDADDCFTLMLEMNCSKIDSITCNISDMLLSL